jgi:hypothetical protein
MQIKLHRTAPYCYAPTPPTRSPDAVLCSRLPTRSTVLADRRATPPAAPRLARARLLNRQVAWKPAPRRNGACLPKVNARPRRDRASAERTGGRGVTRPRKDVAAVRENARDHRSTAPRPIRARPRRNRVRRCRRRLGTERRRRIFLGNRCAAAPSASSDRIRG